MKHIIIVGHGSRVESANKEVAALADALKQSISSSVIHVAFMEFGTPSIPAALAQVVQDGAQEIEVFPYFLVEGAHIRKDIPEILEECSKNHPGINIRMLDYLGKNKTIMGEILKRCLLHS